MYWIPASIRTSSDFAPASGSRQRESKTTLGRAERRNRFAKTNLSRSRSIPTRNVLPSYGFLAALERISSKHNSRYTGSPDNGDARIHHPIAGGNDRSRTHAGWDAGSAENRGASRGSGSGQDDSRQRHRGRLPWGLGRRC